MDIIDEIYEKACALTRGGFSEGEGAVLRELCAAAYEEFSGRLKGDVLLEEIRERFIRACATLGLSLYAGLERPSGFDSFAAGSIRVSRRSAKESRDGAAELRKQAEQMLLGLISDEGFAFRAVES